MNRKQSNNAGSRDIPNYLVDLSESSEDESYDSYSSSTSSDSDEEMFRMKYAKINWIYPAKDQCRSGHRYPVKNGIQRQSNRSHCNGIASRKSSGNNSRYNSNKRIQNNLGYKVSMKDQISGVEFGHHVGIETQSQNKEDGTNDNKILKIKNNGDTGSKKNKITPDKNYANNRKSNQGYLESKELVRQYETENYSKLLRKTAATMFSSYERHEREHLHHRSQKHVTFDIDSQSKRSETWQTQFPLNSCYLDADDQFNDDYENDCVLCNILDNEERVAKRSQDMENFRDLSIIDCQNVFTKLHNVNSILDKYDRNKVMEKRDDNSKIKSKSAEDKPKNGTRLSFNFQESNTAPNNATYFCITGPQKCSSNNRVEESDKVSSPKCRKKLFDLYQVEEDKQEKSDRLVEAVKATDDSQQYSHSVQYHSAKRLHNTEYKPSNTNIIEKSENDTEGRKRLDDLQKYIGRKSYPLNTMLSHKIIPIANEEDIQENTKRPVKTPLGKQENTQSREEKSWLSLAFRRLRRSLSFEGINKKTERRKNNLLRHTFSDFSMAKHGLDRKWKTRSRSYDEIYRK